MRYCHIALGSLKNFSEDRSEEYPYPIYTNANDENSIYRLFKSSKLSSEFHYCKWSWRSRLSRLSRSSIWSNYTTACINSSKEMLPKIFHCMADGKIVEERYAKRVVWSSRAANSEFLAQVYKIDRTPQSLQKRYFSALWYNMFRNPRDDFTNETWVSTMEYKQINDKTIKISLTFEDLKFWY